MKVNVASVSKVTIGQNSSAICHRNSGPNQVRGQQFCIGTTPHLVVTRTVPILEITESEGSVCSSGLGICLYLETSTVSNFPSSNGKIVFTLKTSRGKNTYFIVSNFIAGETKRLCDCRVSDRFAQDETIVSVETAALNSTDDLKILKVATDINPGSNFYGLDPRFSTTAAQWLLDPTNYSGFWVDGSAASNSSLDFEQTPICPKYQSCLLSQANWDLVRAPAPIGPLPVIYAATENFKMSFTLKLNSKVSTWGEILRVKDRTTSSYERYSAGDKQRWPSVWLRPGTLTLGVYIRDCSGDLRNSYTLPTELGNVGDKIDVSIEYQSPALTVQAGNLGPYYDHNFNVDPCLNGDYQALQVEFKNEIPWGAADVDITNFTLNTNIPKDGLV